MSHDGFNTTAIVKNSRKEFVLLVIILQPVEDVDLFSAGGRIRDLLAKEAAHFRHCQHKTANSCNLLESKRETKSIASYFPGVVLEAPFSMQL